MTCRSKRLAQRGPAKRNRRPQNKQPDTNQTNESIRVVVRVSLLTQLEGDIGAGNCRARSLPIVVHAGKMPGRCLAHGVLPSSAAEMFPLQIRGNFTKSRSRSNRAAPEDGHTPLNT